MIPGARIYRNKCQWLYDDGNRQRSQNRNTFHDLLPRVMRAMNFNRVAVVVNARRSSKGAKPQIQKAPSGWKRASTYTAGTGRQLKPPPMDQCRPPLSHRCVQLLRHMLLFPEQLSAQCCLQTAASKANAGTDQTTRLSKATAETSLHIVASLWIALSLVAPCAYFYPNRGHLQIQKGPEGMERGQYPGTGRNRRL